MALPRPLVALAVLIGLTCMGSAAAQCTRGPTTSELSIKGFGAAYFEQVRTDSAHDLVEFYGGVCLAGEGVAWTVLADRITVRGLSGELSVDADNATLLVDGWRLQATNLTADRRRLEMSTVRLESRDVTGTALRAAVDLEAGSVELTRPDLGGSSFHVRGTRAVLDLQAATVSDPVLTSCTCAGAPFYDVSGSSAQVDLATQRVQLADGRLRVGAVVVPLGRSVTLDAATLASLTVPVKVAYVATDAATGVVGTGLGVTLGPLDLAPGVSTEVGATGLDAAYPLAGLALLRGTTPEARFEFGVVAGGPRLTMTSDHAVAPWFDVGFDTRVYGPAERDGLREGVLHARVHQRLAWLGGGVALAGFAAASSQTVGGATVAGPRLGAAFSGTASTPASAWGAASLRWRLAATAYPAQGASQWGVELEPGYRAELGPVRLRVSYLARFTDGGSPFTTTLDRLEPAQRLSLDARLASGSAAGWTVRAGLAARYDAVASSGVVPGLNQVDLSAGLGHRVGSWTIDVDAKAALAGILAPDGARDGFLQAGVSATHARWTFGAEARYGFAPDPPGLTRLQLSAAVPIDLPTVELRPYLAVDLAPTLTGGAWPAISGHGLDVTFLTCCGALSLGYRDQDGVWTVSMAVDLQRRAATGTAAGACPSTPASADALRAPSAAPTCTAGGSAAGIMAGAAPAGPP